MKIIEFYSHLNGWEFLKVHQPHLWDEIVDVIEKIDAESCKTKVSKEKSHKGNYCIAQKTLIENLSGY